MELAADRAAAQTRLKELQQSIATMVSRAAPDVSTRRLCSPRPSSPRLAEAHPAVGAASALRQGCHIHLPCPPARRTPPLYPPPPGRPSAHRMR